MKLELDERIRQELLELYAKLNSKGELLVGAKLTNYYETFRHKFGPDELRKLDGQALLEAMHGPAEISPHKCRGGSGSAPSQLLSPSRSSLSR
jgi:hypothetical protein